MNFTNEQIEKAKQCNTLDELKELAKNEGLTISAEELNEIFNLTRMGELNDDDLNAVAGGKGGYTQDEARKLILEKTKCPNCKASGADLSFYMEIMVISPSNGELLSMASEVSCRKCGTSFVSDYYKIKS